MRAERFLPFALVSAAGLGLDYLVYTLLCGGGLEPEWANLVSASAAVTFVFVASARRIFQARDRFLVRPFVIYLAYQALAVGAASWAVGAMTDVFDGRYILGKTVVVPASFMANFLFMSWLFSTRLLNGGRA
jgi:putative flippase GtrA